MKNIKEKKINFIAVSDFYLIAVGFVQPKPNCIFGNCMCVCLCMCVHVNVIDPWIAVKDWVEKKYKHVRLGIDSEQGARCG